MRHHLREIYPLWQAIMGRAANNLSSYGQRKFQKKQKKKQKSQRWAPFEFNASGLLLQLALLWQPLSLHIPRLQVC